MKVVPNSLMMRPVSSPLRMLQRDGDIEQNAAKAKVGESFDIAINHEDDPTEKRRHIYGRLRRWSRHNSPRDTPIKFATRYIGNDIVRVWRVK